MHVFLNFIVLLHFWNSIFQIALEFDIIKFTDRTIHHGYRSQIYAILSVSYQ